MRGALFAIGLLLSTCFVASAQVAASEPIRVATAVVPHAWLVQEVGGDRVSVRTMVPAGADPHVFQPSDAEISQLMRCRVIFRAGIPLERGPWMEALERSGRVRLVDLREGIALRTMEPEGSAHDHGVGAGCAHEHEDPHTWTSPANLRIQAQTIARALQEIDPDGAEGYGARLAALDRRLERIDDELRTRLEPCRGRAILVLHPAWGYFADRYGIRQVAVEVAGLAPSDAELTALQRLARREGVTTILVPPQVSPRTAKAVADAIGGRVLALDPLARDVPEMLRGIARAVESSR